MIKSFVCSISIVNALHDPAVDCCSCEPCGRRQRMLGQDLSHRRSIASTTNLRNAHGWARPEEMPEADAARSIRHCPKKRGKQTSDRHATSHCSTRATCFWLSLAVRCGSRPPPRIPRLVGASLFTPRPGAARSRGVSHEQKHLWRICHQPGPRKYDVNQPLSDLSETLRPPFVDASL